MITESRDICEYLLVGSAAERLVPSPLEGPIWGYADFADGPLEDILFRIASPAVRDAWPRASDRAMYTLVKERKFGAGCVDAWRRDQAKLVAQAQRHSGSYAAHPRARPFLFGDSPTLADAALYGMAKMVEEGDATLVPLIAEQLPPYLRRVEAHAATVKSTT